MRWPRCSPFIDQVGSRRAIEQPESFDGPLLRHVETASSSLGHKNDTSFHCTFGLVRPSEVDLDRDTIMSESLIDGAASTAAIIHEPTSPIAATNPSENRPISSRATPMPPRGPNVANVLRTPTLAVDHSINHAQGHTISRTVEEISLPSGNIGQFTTHHSSETDGQQSSRPNNNPVNNHNNNDKAIHSRRNFTSNNTNHNNNNNGHGSVDQEETAGGSTYHIAFHTPLDLAKLVCFHRFERRSHCRHYAFVCSDPNTVVSTTLVL